MPEAPARLCLRCGYILDHLPEPRCPECGTPFDPDRPETYACPSARKSPLPYLTLAVAALVMTLPGYDGWPLSRSIAVLMIVGWVIGWWTAVRTFIALNDLRNFRWPLLLVVALLIGLVVGPGGCCLSPLFIRPV